MKAKARYHKSAQDRQGRGADGYLRLLAAVFFLLLPFVFSLQGLDKFRLPKELFLSAGAVVLIAAFLLTRRVSLAGRPARWETLLLAGLLYAGLQSLWAARHLQMTLRAFAVLLLLSLLLLVLREIWSQEFLRRLWFVLGAVAALHSVMTLFQYYGFFSAMVDQQGRTIEGRAIPAGLVGEVQSGAFFFAFCLLLNLYWLFRAPSRSLRLAAAAVVLLNLIGLLYTRTLTTLAALALSLLFWAAYHHWQHFRRGLGVTRAMALLWAGMAAALLLGGVAAHQAGVIDRIQTVAQQMREGDWSVATAGRQPVYALTWSMVLENPLLGTGLDSFGVDFFHYRAETETGRQKQLLEQPGAFREVHNEYLQVWLELGLPGLVAFLALLFWPLVPCLKKAFDLEGGHDPYWWALYAAGVLFVAVECLAFFPFQAPLPAALIILLYSGMRAGQAKAFTQADAAFLSTRAGRLKAFLLIVLALLLIYPRVQAWRANVFMGKGERFLQSAYSQQGSASRRAIAARRALDNLETAVNLCSTCYRAYDLRGSALLLLGRPDKAVESYRRAARYIPSSEVFTNLGVAYMALGRAREARESLQTALHYRPGYAQARQALAQLDQRSR
ncbi:MAG TPA: O-antigen ligase family protein [Acidobacteriota bacterium]|nr:O-antigen ligase family protein [Acidobacteriota bacterium]